MIRVEINGNDIYQSQKNCGVCGEANSTEMVVAFSEDWLAYSKKVVFYDARGSNPVTVALLESNRIRGEEQEVYSFKIPGEPLVYEGKIEFVVDGSIEGVRKKSVGGELRVRYSPDSTSEIVPAEVAQTVAEQLQAEAIRIGDMAVKAVPYIGQNGNWFKYDSELKEYVDTGVCATGSQGEKGAQGPQGEKGEQGERGLQGERGEKGDAGKDGVDGIDGADGYTPVRGVDYWTDADKAEIKSEVQPYVATLGIDVITSTVTDPLKHNGETIDAGFLYDAHAAGRMVILIVNNDTLYTLINVSSTQLEFSSVNLAKVEKLTATPGGWTYSSSYHQDEKYRTNSDNFNPDAYRDYTGNFYYPSTKCMVEYVEGITGNIETALDNIIAIQNNLMGVSA